MWECIEDAIEAEARKRLARRKRVSPRKSEIQDNLAADDSVAADDSLGDTSALPRRRQLDRQFDPYYCLGHSRFLAKGIWRKLSAKTYAPLPTFRFAKSKVDGGLRTIDLFSIPDAAIASVFLKRIRCRNQFIFSESSYAYQPGRSPLQAVERLRTIVAKGRWYIGCYDLERFFETIDHAGLLAVIGTDFRLTEIETALIKAMIAHRWAATDGACGVRTVGIPQGMSLSVVLSNVALHGLDMTVGQACDHYFRYADDILLLNQSMERASHCQQTFRAFARARGLRVSPSKSFEVRTGGDADVGANGCFDYLGYKFTASGTTLPDQAVGQIKRACAKIVYDHIVIHIRRSSRVPRRPVDEDLASAFQNLARYIYGRNTDADLRAYLDGGRVTISDTGILAYYRLVENAAPLRALDGWLVSCVFRACRFRAKLTAGETAATMSKSMLGSIASLRLTRDVSAPDHLACPSFYLAWRALRKRHIRIGLKA